MKNHTFWSQFAWLLPFVSLGQGTFNYDQQSSDESYIAGGVIFQQFQPFGQSFTPSLAGVNFIRLYLYDAGFGTGTGTTVHINLRSNSISGPIVDSTAPILLPDGFGGVTNFFFGASVPLLPGTTYFFQPVVQAGGDPYGIASYNYNYAGGTSYQLGTPFGGDLWFREGIFVPEPAAFTFALVGPALFLLRRSQIRRT